MGSTTGDADRIAALASLTRSFRKHRDADRVTRIRAVADLGRSWLLDHAHEVRRDLADRVAQVERIGTPPSLFTLMGLSRYERPYNRLLAWIADPAAGHGAGRAVLRELAHALDLPALTRDVEDPAASIVVRGEQAWPEEADSGRMPDLLVLTPSLTLLIENKVQAEEGDGQYRDYLDALVRLAEARGTEWAAFLAAPARRSVPSVDDGQRAWTGAVSHAELGRAVRAAAGHTKISAWARVACLLVAQQLEYPDGDAGLQVQARDLLVRTSTTRNVGDVAAMRHLLACWSTVSPPWIEASR